MPTTRKTSPSTPTKKLPEAVEDSKYLAFLQGLQLIGLALKSTAATIKREEFFNAWQKEKSLTRKYDTAYTLMDHAKNFFDCEGTFVVTVTDSKGSSLLSVQCVYEVHMHTKSEFSKERAQRFIDSELKLILAPYARQLVTDLTARMSVPPVILPLSTTA
jgi:hypothetical protein